MDRKMFKVIVNPEVDGITQYEMDKKIIEEQKYDIFERNTMKKIVGLNKEAYIEAAQEFLARIKSNKQ